MVRRERVGQGSRGVGGGGAGGMALHLCAARPCCLRVEVRGVDAVPRRVDAKHVALAVLHQHALLACVGFQQLALQHRSAVPARPACETIRAGHIRRGAPAAIGWLEYCETGCHDQQNCGKWRTRRWRPERHAYTGGRDFTARRHLCGQHSSRPRPTSTTWHTAGGTLRQCPSAWTTC